MEITVLAENKKPADHRLLYEHGLSLYCESHGLKFLFDTGETDVFLRNAEVLGIDLQSVDFAVISHGHYDHGGGLKYFLNLNRTAKIYVSSHARGEFYNKKLAGYEYVGLNPDLFRQFEDRFVFIDTDHEILKGFEIITTINKEFKLPSFCSLMKEKKCGKMANDSLKHEIVLAVKEDDGVKILTGCSHHGIRNIVWTVLKKYGDIAALIGGFHLSGTKFAGIECYKEPMRNIKKLGRQLKDISNVYTGHCTGEKAFRTLQSMSNVKYLSVGQTFSVYG